MMRWLWKGKKMISLSDTTEPLPPLNKRQYTTLAAVGKVVERLGTGEHTNDNPKTVGDAHDNRNRQSIYIPIVPVQRVFKYGPREVSQKKKRNRRPAI